MKMARECVFKKDEDFKFYPKRGGSKVCLNEDLRILVFTTG
jgi:hypothetical protein